MREIDKHSIENRLGEVQEEYCDQNNSIDEYQYMEQNSLDQIGI